MQWNRVNLAQFLCLFKAFGISFVFINHMVNTTLLLFNQNIQLTDFICWNDLQSYEEILPQLKSQIWSEM